MILVAHGYKGKKLWSVSLDHMPPVTVRASTAAAAIFRAAIYYNLDPLKGGWSNRFAAWPYEEPANE